MLINLPPRLMFPERFYVACSGGVDSMALTSFLMKGRHKFSVVHFNHGTPNANQYQAFVQRFCRKNSLPLLIGICQEKPGLGQSMEHYWAQQRHRFFNSLDAPVLLAHHLNDVAETWLMSCLNGNPHLMGWSTQNCIRPFLLTPKENLYTWCREKNVPWIEDKTNEEDLCQRNKIRRNLLPQALEINPGLMTVLKKKLMNVKLKRGSE